MIRILEESSNEMSASSLATRIGVSERTIRNYVSSINEEGVYLIQASHQGYLLKVHPEIARMIYENTTESAPILPKQAGRSIWIQQDPSLHIHDFSIVHIASGEELKRVRSLAKLY